MLVRRSSIVLFRGRHSSSILIHPNYLRSPKTSTQILILIGWIRRTMSHRLRTCTTKERTSTRSTTSKAFPRVITWINSTIVEISWTLIRWITWSTRGRSCRRRNVSTSAWNRATTRSKKWKNWEESGWSSSGSSRGTIMLRMSRKSFRNFIGGTSIIRISLNINQSTWEISSALATNSWTSCPSRNRLHQGRTTSDSSRDSPTTAAQTPLPTRCSKKWKRT